MPDDKKVPLYKPVFSPGATAETSKLDTEAPHILPAESRPFTSVFAGEAPVTTSTSASQNTPSAPEAGTGERPAAGALAQERLPAEIRPNQTPETIEAAIDASIQPGGEPTAPYQTTPKLAGGLFGERMAAEALATQGHEILMYKPDIQGTNQGGFDIVTMYEDKVYFIDNKAYTTGKNVSSASALQENHTQNVEAVRTTFQEYASDPNRSAAEQQKYAHAVELIDKGHTENAVTTAALAPDGKHSVGLTPSMQQSASYIDVFDPTQTSASTLPQGNATTTVAGKAASGTAEGAASPVQNSTILESARPAPAFGANSGMGPATPPTIPSTTPPSTGSAGPGLVPKG